MKEVKIGDQTWATKNLDVTEFRNGDPIPEVRTDADWQKAGKHGKPACCYYENDPANGTKYGKLYNWYAVNDPRGLAPKGWHVPSDAEWTILADYLGGVKEAGTKLKSASDWKNNSNGSNSSGFAGLPGGGRGDGGKFSGIGAFGYWWRSLEGSAGGAWFLFLDYGSGNINRDGNDKRYGFSVRCLGD